MKEQRDTPRPTMSDKDMVKDYPRLSREYTLLHQDYREAIRKPLNIPIVGWQSEQLPDFDVDEINEIVKDCKEKKEDLQTLICMIWNKGYMTAVADEREG